MKQQLLLIPVALCCSMLYAEETSALEKTNPEKSPWELSATTSAAYYPKADHESGSSHFSGISGAYDGAKAVVEFDAAYTLPFLRGDNAFTKENHVKFNMGLEISPVSIAPVASITLSPIAFLEFAIGGTVGTGWYIGNLFQGMSEYNESKPAYRDLTPFAHWYLYGWAKACLMFDLAALWEGDWHHVVATATYKTGYQNITGTDADIWLWQASKGLASGWIYEQEYFLGYQMPLKLSMIGVGATLSGHYQSSDFGKYSSNYKGDFMTIDYSEEVLGLWEGRISSEQSVYDDHLEHRWEYKNDGSYVYYRYTDEGEWVSDVNKLSEYFVDGSLLCTRWEDNDGKEYREWWEIESIKDGVMNWTALRIGDDGKPFTATFSMTKVK